MSTIGYCSECGRYALPEDNWNVTHTDDCPAGTASAKAAEAGRDELILELARQLAEARQQVGKLTEQNAWLVASLGVPGQQDSRHLQAVEA